MSGEAHRINFFPFAGRIFDPVRISLPTNMIIEETALSLSYANHFLIGNRYGENYDNILCVNVSRLANLRNGQ